MFVLFAFPKAGFFCAFAPNPKAWCIPFSKGAVLFPALLLSIAMAANGIISDFSVRVGSQTSLGTLGFPCSLHCHVVSDFSLNLRLPSAFSKACAFSKALAFSPPFVKDLPFPQFFPFPTQSFLQYSQPAISSHLAGFHIAAALLAWLHMKAGSPFLHPFQPFEHGLHCPDVLSSGDSANSLIRLFEGVGNGFLLSFQTSGGPSTRNGFTQPLASGELFLLVHS